MLGLGRHANFLRTPRTAYTREQEAAGRETGYRRLRAGATAAGEASLDRLGPKARKAALRLLSSNAILAQEPSEFARTNMRSVRAVWSQRGCDFRNELLSIGHNNTRKVDGVEIPRSFLV
jgi:hypothetical protein